jgi:hypothetical protein
LANGGGAVCNQMIESREMIPRKGKQLIHDPLLDTTASAALKTASKYAHPQGP